MNYFALIFQLVTHERDMLKKDVKKITMERDGALKHLSLTTGTVLILFYISLEVLTCFFFHYLKIASYS